MARKRRNILPGMFIAFIMIFSAFGVMFYGFSSPSSKFEYNGYRFEATQNGFVTNIEGVRYAFPNHPGNVDQVNISSGIIDRIRGTRMVHLTYDPNQTVVSEIAAAQFQLQQFSS